VRASGDGDVAADAAAGSLRLVRLVAAPFHRDGVRCCLRLALLCGRCYRATARRWACVLTNMVCAARHVADVCAATAHRAGDICGVPLSTPSMLTTGYYAVRFMNAMLYLGTDWDALSRWSRYLVVADVSLDRVLRFAFVSAPPCGHAAARFGLGGIRSETDGLVGRRRLPPLPHCTALCGCGLFPALRSLCLAGYISSVVVLTFIAF